MPLAYACFSAFELPLPVAAAIQCSQAALGPRKNPRSVSSQRNSPARRPAPIAVQVEVPAPAGALPVRESGTRDLDDRAVPALRGGTDDLDFDRVYTEHFAHVSRWARALGGLDADLDDLTQDVFLVVRRKLHTYAGPSLPAWLYGITRKTVSDYRRRAWMRRLWSGVTRSLESSPAAADVAAADPFDRLEAQRIVKHVLDRMSPLRRSAFMLFEIEGYSGEEIAELEQIPLATVYTRLHHARKDFLRLTAEITGEAPEEPPS
jgi:RNA polymerase sigma-70 factor (ECF subfamily)